MRLTKMRVKNYRSIKDTGEILIDPLQAFVGENNSGKSNLLRAIQCFLSAGAGGTTTTDFNEQGSKAIIECEFGGLSETERNRLRPYLLGDRVILRKELSIVRDEIKEKSSIKAEYHGYKAEPKAKFLSIDKIEAEGKPNWQKLAEEFDILRYVQDAGGKINKTTYAAGIARYLSEHEVEYEQPTLGQTQALGIPQNLLATLPEFYLLPAITDYADEIDRRSTTTVFRRLMANLSDRVMTSDPRYSELEEALTKVRSLLNRVAGADVQQRLSALGTMEDSLLKVVHLLMPSVQSIRLEVEVDDSRDIFSKGVGIKIDDGVLTNVMDKGHGMQRTLIFSLLQMLIKATHPVPAEGRPIILAIEEPELYIHPHCQRLIYRVLSAFAGIEDDEKDSTGSDQVIYTTHSPAFIEVWNYQRIGLVRKQDATAGTIVHQVAKDVFGDPEDRKTFKMLTSFGLKHNELFFARYAVLVEGQDDEIGIIATSRKLGRIKELMEELGVSIVVTTGKGDIPKFQKILGAFELSYGVLLEMDGKGENGHQNAPILENLGTNRIVKVATSLEDLLGVGRHFDDQRHAKLFFSDSANINQDMEELVTNLLPPI